MSKPTKAQRNVLERLERGAAIMQAVADPYRVMPMPYWSSGDSEAVHHRVFGVLLRAGWIEGDYRSGMFMWWHLSDAGRAVLAATPTAQATEGSKS